MKTIKQLNGWIGQDKILEQNYQADDNHFKILVILENENLLMIMMTNTRLLIIKELDRNQNKFQKDFSKRKAKHYFQLKKTHTHSIDKSLKKLHRQQTIVSS